MNLRAGPLVQTRRENGFTIVELLIVVVVIAILAAITIVAYSGIQNRAKDSAQRTAVSQAGKKLKTAAIQNNDQYPADKAAFLAQSSLVESANLEYTYVVADSLKDFCVSGINPSASVGAVAVSSSALTPAPGTCVKNFVVNPSMELNQTGWTNRKSATVTRTTTQQHSGSASLAIVTPGTEADEGVNMAVSTGVVPVGTAGTYTGSAWVRGTTGVVLRIFAEEYSGAGAYVAGSAANITLNGNWQRISVARSIAADTSKVAVNVRTLSAVATTFYVDDFMVTAGTQVYQYGDGSLPGWSWSGAQDASSSIGPALNQ